VRSGTCSISARSPAPTSVGPRYPTVRPEVVKNLVAALARSGADRGPLVGAAIHQIDQDAVGAPAFRLVVTGAGPVVVTDDGTVSTPLTALVPWPCSIRDARNRPWVSTQTSAIVLPFRERPSSITARGARTASSAQEPSTSTSAGLRCDRRNSHLPPRQPQALAPRPPRDSGLVHPLS
jgi:hypothetical protein